MKVIDACGKVIRVDGDRSNPRPHLLQRNSDCFPRDPRLVGDEYLNCRHQVDHPTDTSDERGASGTRFLPSKTHNTMPDGEDEGLQARLDPEFAHEIDHVGVDGFATNV